MPCDPEQDIQEQMYDEFFVEGWNDWLDDTDKRDLIGNLFDRHSYVAGQNSAAYRHNWIGDE